MVRSNRCSRLWCHSKARQKLVAHVTIIDILRWQVSSPQKMVGERVLLKAIPNNDGPTTEHRSCLYMCRPLGDYYGSPTLRV